MNNDNEANCTTLPPRIPLRKNISRGTINKRVHSVPNKRGPPTTRGNFRGKRVQRVNRGNRGGGINQNNSKITDGGNQTNRGRVNLRIKSPNTPIKNVSVQRSRTMSEAVFVRNSTTKSPIIAPSIKEPLFRPNPPGGNRTLTSSTQKNKNDPRTVFQVTKGTTQFSSSPSGLNKLSSPSVGSVEIGYQINKSDILEFKASTQPETNSHVKLKHTFSYPNRLSTHSFISQNSEYSGNIKLFDKYLEQFIQNINNSDIRISIHNRIFSSSESLKHSSDPSPASSTSPSTTLHSNPLLQRTISQPLNKTTRSRSGSASTCITPSVTKTIQHEAWDELLNDKNEGIIYADDLIKGGSVENIVLAITNPKFSSPPCLNAFLLTYRAFATPEELLELLISRFHVKSINNQDIEFQKYFEERKRKPIQLRTGNCIRRWVENHWYDFENNDTLYQRLVSWIQGPLSQSNFGTLPKTLTNIIEKKKQGGLRGIKFSDVTPVPIIPRSDKFIDFSPKEVARQLTLLEFQDYQMIHPTECMRQSWTKKDKDILSPYICKMIKKSNIIPMWIATQILLGTEQKQRLRSKMIILFIKIAKECNKINNFNAVMEIIAGLSLSSIHRLTKSWEGVPKKYIDILNDLRNMMNVSENWKSYRNELLQRDPPCLPYFGMYLTDLTFIEDGHPDYIGDSNNIINFIKCRQMAVVIQNIQQYQQKQYAFEPVPAIMSYLLKVTYKTDEELYSTSLEVEPRQ